MKFAPITLAMMTLIARAAIAEEPAHEHMDDDPLRAFVLVDRLEWQSGGADDRLAWEVDGWIGKDANRLWLRTEGERAGDSTEWSALEALWGRSIARWWDLVAGVRHDFEPGTSRNWAALGVVGIAPYDFEVKLTGYLGERATTAFQASAEIDLLLTRRWIMQPRIEAAWWGNSTTAEGVAGIRLRYEIRRELAPYAGLEWQRPFEGRDALRVVAGLRAWL